MNEECEMRCGTLAHLIGILFFKIDNPTSYKSVYHFVHESIKETFRAMVQCAEQCAHLLHGRTQIPQHFSIPERFFSASRMSALIWSIPSSILSNCSVHTHTTLYHCTPPTAMNKAPTVINVTRFSKYFVLGSSFK